MEKGGEGRKGKKGSEGSNVGIENGRLRGW
jgi:hypothetical protein